MILAQILECPLEALEPFDPAAMTARRYVTGVRFPTALTNWVAPQSLRDFENGVFCYGP